MLFWWLMGGEMPRWSSEVRSKVDSWMIRIFSNLPIKGNSNSSSLIGKFLLFPSMMESPHLNSKKKTKVYDYFSSCQFATQWKLNRDGRIPHDAVSRCFFLLLLAKRYPSDWLTLPWNRNSNSSFSSSFLLSSSLHRDWKPFWNFFSLHFYCSGKRRRRRKFLFIIRLIFSSFSLLREEESFRLRKMLENKNLLFKDSVKLRWDSKQIRRKLCCNRAWLGEVCNCRWNFRSANTEKLSSRPFTSSRIRLRIFPHTYRRQLNWLLLPFVFLHFACQFRSLPKLLAIRIQDLDTRIIIGSFSDEIAPKIFCEVTWKIHESSVGRERISFSAILARPPNENRRRR